MAQSTRLGLVLFVPVQLYLRCFTPHSWHAATHALGYNCSIAQETCPGCSPPPSCILFNSQLKFSCSERPCLPQHLSKNQHMTHHYNPSWHLEFLSIVPPHSVTGFAWGLSLPPSACVGMSLQFTMLGQCSLSQHWDPVHVVNHCYCEILQCKNYGTCKLTAYQVNVTWIS